MSLQAVSHLASFLYFPPLCASCLPVIESQPHIATVMFCQEYGAKSPWTEPSEMWAKINPVSLELFIARILITMMTITKASYVHFVASMCSAFSTAILSCPFMKLLSCPSFSSHQLPAGADHSVTIHVTTFLTFCLWSKLVLFLRDVAMLASVKPSRNSFHLCL